MVVIFLRLSLPFDFLLLLDMADIPFPFALRLCIPRKVFLWLGRCRLPTGLTTTAFFFIPPFRFFSLEGFIRCIASEPPLLLLLLLLSFGLTWYREVSFVQAEDGFHFVLGVGRPTFIPRLDLSDAQLQRHASDKSRIKIQMDDIDLACLRDKFFFFSIIVISLSNLL